MKENLKLKIMKRFSDVKLSKVILYNNPNQFTSLYIERVNPNHIGILWGKRHKKLNKGTHYVKVGKVFFSFIPVVFGSSVLAWIDMATGYTYNLILTTGILTTFICVLTTGLLYYIPIKLTMRKPNGIAR